MISVNILFHLLFFSIVFSNHLFAQNVGKNKEKYWFYRDRLKNAYMAIGDQSGCSIPAEKRHGNGVLEWDDGSNLYWYISVLATEYKLLSQQGKDVSGTVEELYFALNAINRLDLWAETYWERFYDKDDHVPDPNRVPYPDNCSGSSIFNSDCNGFFVRDDVRKEPTQPPVQTFLNQVDASSGQTFETKLNHNIGLYSVHAAPINDILSQYSRKIVNDSYTSPSGIGPNEGNSDKLLSMMMGLALVKRLVNSHVEYNGTNIVDMVEDIFKRTFGWVLKDPFWVIRNPVTGQCVRGDDWEDNNCEDGGANMFLYAYGVAKIAVNVFDFNILIMADPIVILNNSLWLHKYIFLPEKYGSSTQVGAVGKVWGDLTKTIVNEQSENNNWEYYPLIYSVLYPSDGAPKIERSFYQQLIDDAPCNGPRDNSGIYDWSTRNRFRDPEKRHIFGGNTDEYHGLDYMLLYNLYQLVYGGEIELVTTFSYPLFYKFPTSLLTPNDMFSDVELAELILKDVELFAYRNTPYPLLPPDLQQLVFDNAPGGAIWGTKDYPFVSLSTNIVSDSRIQSIAKVTFMASNSIELLPGFEAENGSDFEAFIAPGYDCEYFGTGVYSNLVPIGSSEGSSLIAADENESSTILEDIQQQISHGNRVYPNPFTQITNVFYSLQEPSAVSITIYNAYGEEVSRLVDKKLTEAGSHHSTWDASILPPGVYFCLVEIKSESGKMLSETRKLVKLR